MKFSTLALVTLISTICCVSANEQKQQQHQQSLRDDVMVLMFETDETLQHDPKSPLHFFREKGDTAHLQTTVYGGKLDYHGFGDKYQTLKPLLEIMDSDKLVILADARDVVLNVPDNEAFASLAVDNFIETYRKLTKDTPGAVVMSAEAQCCVSAMSHAHPSEYFDPITKKRTKRACSSGLGECMWYPSQNIEDWQVFMEDLAFNTTGEENSDVYLNAGLMVGYPADLINLLNVLDIGPAEDDQAVLSGLMYQFPDMIKLDYKQEMFGNNQWPKGLVDGCMFESQGDHLSLIHTETGTEPLVLHTPGKFYDCLDVLIEDLGGVSQQRYLFDVRNMDEVMMAEGFSVEDRKLVENYGYGAGSNNYSPNYGYGSSNYSPNYGYGESNYSPNYGYGSSNYSPNYGYGSSNYGYGSSNYSSNYGASNYGVSNYGYGSSNYSPNYGYGSSNYSPNYGYGSNYSPSNYSMHHNYGIAGGSRRLTFLVRIQNIVEEIKARLEGRADGPLTVKITEEDDTEEVDAEAPANYGQYGVASNNYGYGVASNYGQENYGQYGGTSNYGYGVASNYGYGVASNYAPENYGQYGVASNNYGVASNYGSENYGQYGVASNNYGIAGRSNYGYGVASNYAPGNYGQYGIASNYASENYGQYGASNNYGYGVASNNYGYGVASNNYGYGVASNYGQENYGQYGEASNYGNADANYGQYGYGQYGSNYDSSSSVPTPSRRIRRVRGLRTRQHKE